MSDNFTNLLNLPEVRVQSWTFTEHSFHFNLVIISPAISCPYCYQNTTELHQVRPITVRDLPVNGKAVYLNLPRRQFYCRFCQRYITEQLEFMQLRRRYTQRYEENIYNQVNQSNFEQISQQEQLDIKEVKNIYNHIKTFQEPKFRLQNYISSH